MKLGVLTVPLYDRSAEEAFAWFSARGVQSLEIGTGGSPGKGHCDIDAMLADESKITEYQALLKKYNLEISALSVHSNHVHPNKEIRETAHREFINTCKLAQKLGVTTVVTFSGCPGDHLGAKYPNWVTCGWPTDYPEILKYQWEEELIPYWQGAVKEAAQYGVTKIALEMHAGFCVHNAATLLRLREAVGPAIGANFDPSHLYWQGCDPVEAIKALKGAIYHFHAKDTQMLPASKVDGVVNSQGYWDFVKSPWVFRTVGYGHDLLEWKNIISALKSTGYDGVISIEHEDALMSVEEGLEKAIEALKPIIIRDKPSGEFWL